MKNAPIFDRTIQLIEDRLNIIAQSQRLASSNLANVSTPRYVAKTVSFQGTLDEESVQLARSNSLHITPEESSTTLLHSKVEETGPVSMEQEMTKLAKNSVDYQYMVAMLNKKIAMLKSVIAEGGN
jgi:flagellar basal-body rod protein FlgB